MNSLFLYLKMLRAVTFFMKPRRRHIGVMYSSSMRLPDLGARGRMSWDGFSESSCRHAQRVASVVVSTAIGITVRTYSHRMGV